MGNRTKIRVSIVGLGFAIAVAPLAAEIESMEENCKTEIVELH
jgi:hypothetical protein